MLQGVYRPVSVPDSPEARARAAMLVVRPFAVICDRTASWLHGIDTFEYRELDILPPVETIVLRGNNRVRRQGCTGGIRDLARADIMEIEGFRLTTPVRTAMDLACKLSRYEALAVLDGFMRRHGLTQADLKAELPRYRRRRGVVQLRQLIPIADPQAESSGESWTRLAIIDAGLPTPQPQYWVSDGDFDTYRLDLAYPKHRVAIEYDGRDFHSTPAQRAADEARRHWLREQDWIVIVVDKGSFSSQALARWIQELREALGLS